MSLSVTASHGRYFPAQLCKDQLAVVLVAAHSCMFPVGMLHKHIQTTSGSPISCLLFNFNV